MGQTVLTDIKNIASNTLGSGLNKSVANGTDFLIDSNQLFLDSFGATSPFVEVAVYGDGSGVSNELGLLNGLPVSEFNSIDQFIFDQILDNNFDIISSNRLFDKIKNYEHEYNTPSDIFFEKWLKGEVPPSPAIHDWMNTYKNLFQTNGKSEKSN